MRLQMRGVVTDGGFRDSIRIGELDMPAYHNWPSSATNLTLHQAFDLNVPIGCGDVAVFPGDILVGDDDSGIVITAHFVDEVADDAFEITAYEDFSVEEVRAGKPITGLYPATKDESLEAFAKWRTKHNR
jgi:regulator of RNase E activity RraA